MDTLPKPFVPPGEASAPAKHHFESPDDLEEYGGDFRNFVKPDEQTVAGILDRRRRTRMRADSEESRPEPPPEPYRTAGRASLAGVASLGDDPVRLTSKGCTLIVGRNARQVLSCGQRLADHLSCLMLVEGAAPRPAAAEDPTPALLFATRIRIHGYLGRFQATAWVRGKETHLSRLLEGAPEHIDLVLDLRPEAGGEPLPLGYHAVPDGDSEELQRVLKALSGLVGVFEKPRFVHHAVEDCAGLRSGFRTCRRCIETCPVAALSAADGSIRIEHAACMGCGVCTVVCPTGAMKSRLAPPQELLAAVRSRLSAAMAENRMAPTVVFHTLGEDAVEEPAGRGWPAMGVAVPEIGCIGPEVWLSSLAYGAGRVILRPPHGYPIRLRNALAGELEWVAALLSGLGLAPGRVQLACGRSAGTPDAVCEENRVAPAGFTPFQSKRALIRQSASHLSARSPQSRCAVDLPTGAPFGQVHVDGRLCTLCLACAGACPTGALSAAGDVPALRLSEFECIQCGLCRKVCPEQAAALWPRMLLDPVCNGSAQVLYEQEPLACICCGKAFAPTALVARMIERLHGHPMFTRDAEIRRLKMCRDCRVRDIFSHPANGVS